jgi:hypothetical protein
LTNNQRNQQKNLSGPTLCQLCSDFTSVFQKLLYIGPWLCLFFWLYIGLSKMISGRPYVVSFFLNLCRFEKLTDFVSFFLTLCWFLKQHNVGRRNVIFVLTSGRSLKMTLIGLTLRCFIFVLTLGRFRKMTLCRWWY